MSIRERWRRRRAARRAAAIRYVAAHQALWRLADEAFSPSCGRSSASAGSLTTSANGGG